MGALHKNAETKFVSLVNSRLYALMANWFQTFEYERKITMSGVLAPCTKMALVRGKIN